MRKHRRFWILWFALALGLSLGLCASGLAEGGVQTPTDLSGVGAQLSATSATYNGSVQKPTVIVPGFTSADYTVDYGAGGYISARDYFITVTGNGTTLRGSVTLQYTINQLSISGGTVSLNQTNFTYQKGVPQQPTVTGVSAGGVTLQASDYTVTFPADSTNVGSYQVTVTGQGNCKDTATGTYTIQAQSLQAGNVTVSPTELTYDGAEHAITVAVRDQNGNPLSQGTDYTVSGPDKVEAAGNYTVAVNGMGNYSGNVNVTVTVHHASINLATITVTESATYNGQRQEPQVTVTAFGQTLTAEDYAVSYDGALTNADTYSVTITGKGNYTGSVTKENVYEIKPADIAVATVSVTPTTAVYNGQRQEPRVTVTAFGKTLVAGTDYTVAYSDGTLTDVGQYSVKITGKGNYFGAVTKENAYEITRVDFASAVTVSVQPTTAVYNGQRQEPRVTVTAFGRPVAAEDYSVSFNGALTDAGTYSVTITGKRNFIGDITKKNVYEIKPATLSTVAKASLEPEKTTYNGQTQEPQVTVTAFGKTLVKETDYTVEYSDSTLKAAHPYTVKIKGKGNYTGELTLTYVIEPKPLADGDVTLDWEKTVYNSKVQKAKPTVMVTLADGVPTTLQEGQDYTVRYENAASTDVETYTVTVTGTGNYADTVFKKYEIMSAALKDVAAASIETVTYNGQAQMPVITVTAFGQTLEEGTDYSVSYGESKLIDAGSYTVKITGNGNYTGELTPTYVIEPKPLADGDVTLDWEEAVYNRRVQKAKPIVTVTLADGAPTTLQEGTDYTVAYEDDASTDAKTYQVTVTGRGNYQGDISETYTIIPYDLATHGVTIADITDDEFVTYNGLAKEPRPDVFDKETQQLTADTDITYSYADNVLVGTATVTVSGTGSNYTGSAEKTFAIDWLATDAEAILIGTMGDHGWYKEKTVQVTAPAGFTIGIGIDAAEAGWKPYLEGHEGINQVTYHLRDEAGYIMDALSVSFMQDTVAPTSRPLGASFRSGSMLIAVASDPMVNEDPTTASGAVLQFIINNGTPAEFTAENSQPAEKVAANEVCGSCAIVGPGTYRIVLLDSAGNVVGEIFNHYFSDSDGDGLSDVYEENNPRLGPGAVHEPDFDHDGLMDGQELLQYRTDPSQADSDHDGLLDGEEVLQYHTNPTSADSDLDGVDDYTSVAAAAHFDYLTYPTALRVMLRAGANQAEALLDQAAMVDALNKLTEYNYLEAHQPRLYEAFRSTALRRQTADGAYQLFNFVKGLDNSLVKANVAQRMAYGINTEGGLFVTFTADEKNNRFTPVSAYALEELFGMAGDAYSVTCDDQGTLFLVACWSGESQVAQSDLALLVPSQGTAYRLPGTAGSSRFGVSPDGSKLAYVLGGKANVIDLVTCNAAGEYVVDASTLGFTQDGGIITALNGHQADVWHVDAGTYAMTMSKVDFNGIVDLVQPTTDSRSLMVLLGGDDQLLDGKDQVRVDVQGRATLLNGMRGLAYRPAGAPRSTSHSGFFAQ